MQRDATHNIDLPAARIAALEDALEAERARSSALEIRTRDLAAERDRLRTAYQALQLELELLRRRIFMAKAERVDTAQLELEFASKLAELDALAGIKPSSEDNDEAPKPKQKAKPRGRRDLRELDVPQERVELVDPELEGKFPRIGFEESAKLMWRRGGVVTLVVARAKYKTTADGETAVVTAPLGPETFTRSMAAPSMLAHVITDKLCDGLPLHRQEDRFARDGVPIDRGTMSRWVEDAGATVGATVVEAMREEAMKTAFCIATDATGLAVQPEPRGDKKRQPCRRGHYFVMVVDLMAVFFEFTERETSAVVGRMFHGFQGYVQADAKSVYDVLFVPPDERPPPDDGAEPDGAVRAEVGCWSHARRKFWEAAMAKDLVAREALVRIGRVFDLERDCKGKPPAEIKARRMAHTRPHLVAFFAWAEAEYEKVKGERGALRSALGYALRQREALMRFLEDGRLVIDNNRSERELRRVAVGRKAWLFAGSDEHAQAAGHLLTLIATARLHRLDPEAYLRDLFRVLAHWPRDRYLELAPQRWATTRARLDPAQLAAELGPLTVPTIEPPAQKPAPS